MSRKHGKKFLTLSKLIENKLYDSISAFDILTNNSNKNNSIDVSFVLGINPKKSDQVVKGIVPNMPSGLGKKVSIAIFSKANHDQILKLGADYTGFEDLVADIKNEKINADVYIATREIMPELAKLGLARILKNKMPNPKNGTVIEEKDIAHAIKEQKAGKLIFRSNATLIQASIGRASFTSEELKANLKELYNSIIAARPQAVKPHNYLKRLFVSATMSPSIQIDLGSIK